MHCSNSAAHTGCHVPSILDPPSASSATPGNLETTMEIVNRLNVLAALTSFGFLAAVVMGMV